MAKVFGEAIQDPTSRKWGWSVSHEEAGRLFEPEFVFDTKEEAEAGLIEALQGLGEFARHQER